jgi:hypothetical protein
MALLAEGISVVIKRVAINKKYPGGWYGFVKDVPNETLCNDDNIARVGFMTPLDVRNYIECLEGYGFQHMVNDDATDMVVVDQLRGLCGKCNWLEVIYFFIDDDRKKKVTACQIVGDDSRDMYSPDGWDFESSLSNQYAFVPCVQEDKSVKYLGHENGLDVYLNVLTGESVYMGRSGNKKIS